jgi:hypothetical protein
VLSYVDDLSLMRIDRGSHLSDILGGLASMLRTAILTRPSTIRGDHLCDTQHLRGLPGALLCGSPARRHRDVPQSLLHAALHGARNLVETVLCCQQRCRLVPGKTSSSAFQKPSAPSPTASSGATCSPRRLDQKLAPALGALAHANLEGELLAI